MLDAAALGGLCVLVSRLPPRLLPLLCLWSTPLAVSSYAVQALEAYRMGSSDSANRTYAIALRWLGSLIRIGTTIRLLGGDRAALANHAIGFIGCSVLLLQRALYDERGPSKLQARRALFSLSLIHI